MNIVFRVQHDELTDAAREYAETRVATFLKFIPTLREAYITYTKDMHHKSGDVAHVEVSLRVENDADATLIAEAEGASFQETLDVVVGKLKHQVEGYKNKQDSKDRSAQRALEE